MTAKTMFSEAGEKIDVTRASAEFEHWETMNLHAKRVVDSLFYRDPIQMDAFCFNTAILCALNKEKSTLELASIIEQRLRNFIQERLMACENQTLNP